MQEKRCSFSVAVLEGSIYAIGGHRDSEYTESVEQYCSTGNSWRYVEQPSTNYDTSACFVGTTSIQHNVIFSFDVYDGSWEVACAGLNKAYSVLV